MKKFVFLLFSCLMLLCTALSDVKSAPIADEVNVECADFQNAVVCGTQTDFSFTLAQSTFAECSILPAYRQVASYPAAAPPIFADASRYEHNIKLKEKHSKAVQKANFITHYYNKIPPLRRIRQQN